MKNFVLFLFSFLLIVGAGASAGLFNPTIPAGPQAQPTLLAEGVQSLAGTSAIRIENEGKLVVPKELLEPVWAYMLQRLVTDKTFIKGLDAGLDSYWYDELFQDVYFDTPDLRLLARQSSVRHRTRQNLTNPESDKNGRELLQIKLSNVDSNVFSRGEIKFAIHYDRKPDETDDFSPVLGIIKTSDRPQFKSVMTQLNIDPYALKEILTINQRRRSIYITLNGNPFISVRLDEDSSDLLGAGWRHVEIEPELNEIPYTEANSAERIRMQGINSKILDDIQEKFPAIKLDLTPKYNKAFNYFASKIPLLRFLIKNNFQ